MKDLIKVSIITPGNDNSFIRRQTPNNDGVWGRCKFKLNEFSDFDYAIVLNYLHKDLNVSNRENVWLFIMEPYQKGIYDWVLEGHNQYQRIFTHEIPRFTDSCEYILTPPLIGWFLNCSYSELKMMRSVPEKPKSISCVSSTKTMFPGHKARIEFVNYLMRKKIVPGIDFFGKGINFVEDKGKALFPYKYTISIENSSKKDYWTEKISDAYLAYCVPFYYGCTNLSHYFPENSYVSIDINDPKKSLEIINSVLSDPDDYLSRLPSIIKAREMVLERYNFLLYLSEKITEHYDSQDSSGKYITDTYHYKKFNPSFRSKFCNISGKLLRRW